MNSCHSFGACGKNYSAPTWSLDSSEVQAGCFSLVNECWGRKHLQFHFAGLKPVFVNDVPCWVYFRCDDRSWWWLPVMRGRGISLCWAPHCFLNWSDSLGSQFAPVKPFSCLLHIPRVTKVEGQRQVLCKGMLSGNPFITVHHQNLLFNN